MTHCGRMLLIPFLSALLCLSRPTSGLPGGAPPDTCRDLTPRHPGGKLADGPTPYQVRPAAGEGRVRLILGSPQGFAYQGFILLARDLATGENVGTYANLPETAKVVQCAPEVPGQAVTHTNTKSKHNLEFDWEVPSPDYEGTIVFNATFAQDYSTYWVGVESPIVKVSKRAIDVVTSPPKYPSSTDPAGSTTPPYFEPKSTTESQVGDAEDQEFYLECGKTKNCFGIPNDCVETKSCTAVVGVLVTGDQYLFELRTLRGKYVAVGLSDDRNMGEDSVVECVNQGDQVGLYPSWNAGKSNSRVQLPAGALRMESSSIRDEKMACKFWRDKLTAVNNVEFDLVKNQYHLLLAAGNSFTANGVGGHDIGKAATAQKKFLSDVGDFAAASDLLLRLHGALMLASWIGTASVGILLARYYKQTWVGSQLCGKDQWFAWHRFFMLLTWAMTIAAFVLIFVEVGEWSSATIHASFGLATTILCFVQPFMAAMRPHPGAPRRRLFNWSHWFVGNAAHICGIIAIFFAVRLNKARLPEWVDWILVAYVAFYVFVHLLLSVVGCSSDRRARQSFDSFAMKDVHSRSPMGHSELRRDAPYSAVRRGIFGIYFIVVLVITVSLIVITVLAPIEESWTSFKTNILSH